MNRLQRLVSAWGMARPPLVFAQRTAATSSGTVADPAGALVPGAHVTVTNTSTGQFSGNEIPVSRFDPASVNIMKRLAVCQPDNELMVYIKPRLSPRTITSGPVGHAGGPE